MYICVCTYIYINFVHTNFMYLNLFLLLNIISRLSFYDFTSLLRNHFAWNPYNIPSETFCKIILCYKYRVELQVTKCSSKRTCYQHFFDQHQPLSYSVFISTSPCFRACCLTDDHQAKFTILVNSHFAAAFVKWRSQVSCSKKQYFLSLSVRSKKLS